MLPQKEPSQIAQYSRCYKYVNSPKSFSPAEQDCNSIGGHLVSIQNGFENGLVAGIFPLLPYSSPQERLPPISDSRVIGLGPNSMVFLGPGRMDCHLPTRIGNRINRTTLRLRLMSTRWVITGARILPPWRDLTSVLCHRRFPQLSGRVLQRRPTAAGIVKMAGPFTEQLILVIRYCSYSTHFRELSPL